MNVLHIVWIQSTWCSVRMIYTPYKNGSSSVEDEVHEVLRNLHTLDGKRTVILVILVLVMFFPLVTNGIVLTTYARFGCLRRTHDKLIINLAVLNIIIVLSVPFYASSLILPEYVLTKKHLCLLNFTVFRSGILASLFVLLGLALERLICIVNPWKYRKVNSCHVIAWNVCSFLFGYIYFLLPFFGWNNWDKYGVCTIHVFTDSFRIGAEVLVLCLLVANSCIHLYLFYIARGQSKRIDSLIKSVQLQHTGNGKRGYRKRKAFVTVFMLAFMSTLCWLPHLFVVCFVIYFKMGFIFKQVLTEISYVPVLLNSGFSPVIFGYRNRHFRSAIKSLLWRVKHECV